MYSSSNAEYLTHKGVLVEEVGCTLNFTICQGKINVFELKLFCGYF